MGVRFFKPEQLVDKYPYFVGIAQRLGQDKELEDYLLTIEGLWFRNCVWADEDAPEEFYFEKEEDAIMFALRWR